MDGWSRHMMAARFHPGALTDAEWAWFEAQQAAACPDTVLALLAALVGANLVDRLPGLRPPLLLLHPDGSPFIPVPVMADFHARVPGARLHVFGHAKHGLPFSHGAECARVVRGFLDGR
jgi:pimeloyl-ACP methyl ester carboxylesterase